MRPETFFERQQPPLVRWDQRRVDEWQTATFGQSTAIARAARMNVEVTELLTDLGEGVDPLLDHLLKANMQLAEALCSRVNELTSRALETKHPFRNPGAARGKECPDILIVLYGVAGSCGIELLPATDDKMDINEKRKWGKLASGRFQHR